MNRRRSNLTDRQAEDIGIAGVLVLAGLVLMISTTILTLAKTACAPAARLVPASSSYLPPYQQAQHWPASEQAGELARFYRENF